jgi:hypothetical protein
VIRSWLVASDRSVIQEGGDALADRLGAFGGG